MDGCDPTQDERTNRVQQQERLAMAVHLSELGQPVGSQDQDRTEDLKSLFSQRAHGRLFICALGSG